jgi:hypothetical protein
VTVAGSPLLFVNCLAISAAEDFFVTKKIQCREKAVMVQSGKDVPQTHVADSRSFAGICGLLLNRRLSA